MSFHLIKRVGLFRRNVCLAKHVGASRTKPEKDDIIFDQNLNHHQRHLVPEGWNEMHSSQKDMQKNLQKNYGNHYFVFRACTS